MNRVGEALGVDAVLAVAVRAYSQFAVHARFDSVVTAEALPVLWSVVGEAERAGYPAQLDDFVGLHQERLVRLYADYGPGSAFAVGGRFEVLAHPVSLVALERWAAVPFTLAEAWQESLPAQWLDDLDGAWGVRLP